MIPTECMCAHHMNLIINIISVNNIHTFTTTQLMCVSCSCCTRCWGLTYDSTVSMSLPTHTCQHCSVSSHYISIQNEVKAFVYDCARSSKKNNDINHSVLVMETEFPVTLFIIIIISIQPLGQFGQEPEPSQAAGMALVHCILGKFLGVVCHCLDIPTFAARCLHVHDDARDPSSERWNYGQERLSGNFAYMASLSTPLGIFYIS